MDQLTVVFFDDILVYSKSRKVHVEHLRTSLQLLRDNQLYAKFNKYGFLLEQIAFVGHVVSNEGLAVDPSKIKAILNWQSPKNVAETRSFLSLAG